MVDMARIRKGMEVRTSDGVGLGKVSEVYVGTDPTSSTARCDEEVCSRLEVRKGGLLGRGQPSYIPYSAIGSVEADAVVLSVDSGTAGAKGWGRKPSWIGA